MSGDAGAPAVACVQAPGKGAVSDADGGDGGSGASVAPCAQVLGTSAARDAEDGDGRSGASTAACAQAPGTAAVRDAEGGGIEASAAARAQVPGTAAARDAEGGGGGSGASVAGPAEASGKAAASNPGTPELQPSPEGSGGGDGGARAEEADESTAAAPEGAGGGGAGARAQAGEATAATPEPEPPAAPREPPPVQVCVRLRPLLGWESTEGLESRSLELRDGVEGSVTLKPREGAEDSRRARSFRFDAVIGPERSQADLWGLACLGGLVEKVVEGFHATVFAYGQTGSGKTHTMEGFTYEHYNGSSAPSAAAARPRVRPQDTPEEQLGIVPRAVAAVFSRLKELQSAAEGAQERAHVRVSFLQIYNEHIYDLLNPAHAPSVRDSRGEEFQGLRLRWDAATNSFFVENLFSYECQSADEVLKYYSSGVQCKQVASTAMNVASSRSHTVLVLTVVRQSGLAGGIPEEGSAPVPAREVVSRLSLVDLAGSERASATSGCERSATRFQEAVNVNQSLFVLRRVITALSKRSSNQAGGPKTHIPYRESKLTSLLQHAIGGNSFLLMLACLSPADKHFEENLSTLQYASQAADIRNEPTVNLDPKDRLIQDLQAKLAAAHAYILRLTGLSELPEELLQARPQRCSRRGRHTSARTPGGRVRSSERSAAQPPAAAVPAPPTSAPPTLEGSASSASVAPAANARLRSARATQRSPWSTASRSPRETSSGTPWTAPQAASTAAAPPTSPRAAKEGDSLFAAADALLAGYTSGASSLRRRQGGGRSASGSVAWASAAGAASGTPRGEDWKSSSRIPSVPPMLPKTGLPPVATNGKLRSAEQLTMYQPAPASLPSPRHLTGGRARSLHGAPQVPLHSADSPRHKPRAELLPSPRASRAPETRRHSTPGAAAAAGPMLAEARCAADGPDGGLHEPQAEPPPSPRASGALETGRSSPPGAAAAAEPERAEAGCDAGRSDAAINGGLWDAVEELREAKSDLQAQLRKAERRSRELEGELLELRSARAKSPPQAEEAARTAAAEALAAAQAQVRAAESRAQDLEGELLELRSAQAQRTASPDGEAAHTPEAVHGVSLKVPAAVEAETESLRHEKQLLATENSDLRRERASLQQRLDVFYQALELEKASDGAGDDLKESSPSEFHAGPKAGLLQQVECLHSRLILESVTLRNEVSRLKKKKWVLRAVLANGGENEQRAIDEELALSRAAKLERSRQTPAAGRPADVGLDI